MLKVHQDRRVPSRTADRPVDSTVDRTLTALEDAPVWAEIQRAALVLAQYPEREQCESAETDDTTVRRFAIAGEWYDVRSGTVAGPGSPVIVVVLEHRAPTLPTDEQMLNGFRFTASEARVARLLADRRSNREIAGELDVTEHTARRHTEKVLRKLGVSRRAEVEHALAAQRREQASGVAHRISRSRHQRHSLRRVDVPVA